jgi:DNA-binding NarL/FixJ family response regulator
MMPRRKKVQEETPDLRQMGGGNQGAPATELAEQPAAEPEPAKLTRRQLVVLHLVVAGLTNQEVAERLGLSVHTIESHLHTIYGKLGVTHRSAAIRFAIDHDLV